MKNFIGIAALLAIAATMSTTGAQAQEDASKNRRFVSQKENGMIKQQPARHLFADSILAKKPVATENSATEIEQKSEAVATDSITPDCCNCCDKHKEYRQHKRFQHKKERGPHQRQREHHKRGRIKK